MSNIFDEIDTTNMTEGEKINVKLKSAEYDMRKELCDDVINFYHIQRGLLFIIIISFFTFIISYVFFSYEAVASRAFILSMICFGLWFLFKLLHILSRLVYIHAMKDWN